MVMGDVFWRAELWFSERSTRAGGIPIQKFSGRFSHHLIVSG